MRITTTDGKIYTIPDMCAHCRVDTAGNHEANCPLAVSFYNNGEDNYFDIILRDIHSVVKGRLKDWDETEHKGEKLLFMSA